MARRSASLPPSVLPLAGESDRPLRWRLHQGLKAAILGGQLAPGTRLPSTRALAESLGVSRSTVVEAFDQLAAEGFLDRRAGSGSYVGEQLHALRPATTPRRPAPPVPDAGRTTEPPTAFTPCEPDGDLFPHQLWARILARHTRRRTTGFDPAGLPGLRQALASYLTLARGVNTAPDRIFVVTGAQQAILLAAHAVLARGDRVWFEDPGYPTGRAGLALAGLEPVGVPLDADGLNITEGQRLAPDARAAYLTPSHQYPTGVVMGLRRRLELLSWAERAGAWLFEDDYDSEFSYAGRPLPALQGIDRGESVVYIGTFNKITYPGFQLGFVVAPPSAAGSFAGVAAAAAATPPVPVQSAFAEFVADGHLAHHVTRARTLYRHRQDTLIAELHDQLGDRVRIHQPAVGMHLIAELTGCSAEAVARHGRRAGLDLRPLSAYSSGTARVAEALVLGYGHLSPDQIREGVRSLAGCAGRRRQ
ncbi:PLP-dependent aminotransferase family protein [Amycolatopsis suaedae]|uniref:PLP-dependent aminotransferase family protein n=1 Tax=Amycolatopsis suaedae TaxID=2510978 RepID=A0A4Q7J4I4_9PSEU|nr:PLP-dependent aminotransferase family protein [Amycolatopsis suaedae]RZQ61203.1 PLP-dependent aminotransferase family protein [Amycolatopsis suaedae]